jgi:hypothetical protein
MNIAKPVKTRAPNLQFVEIKELHLIYFDFGLWKHSRLFGTKDFSLPVFFEFFTFFGFT